jgi:hypothetical protein
VFWFISEHNAEKTGDFLTTDLNKTETEEVDEKYQASLRRTCSKLPKRIKYYRFALLKVHQPICAHMKI